MRLAALLVVEVNAEIIGELCGKSEGFRGEPSGLGLGYAHLHRRRWAWFLCARCNDKSWQKVPLLGIGSGTINVGPIVAFGIEDIPMLDISKLFVKTIDAVEISVDGKHLAYALNDAIIGNSFLGTLEGRVVNLSAKALLDDGRKQEIEPSSDIVSRDFCIRKNGFRIENSMKKPAQIIVSPLRKREFFARAIAGVLCNASYMDGAAALGLFDTSL